MNKKFIAFLSFILTAVFSLSGCTYYTELEVSNAFYGGSDGAEVPTNYTEQLTYKVTFSDEDMDDRIKADTDLVIEFGEGTYTSTLKVLSGFPSKASLSQKEIKSDIIDNLADNQKQAYHLTTKLTIPVKYSYPDFDKDGNPYTHVYEWKDEIESEVYFCDRTLKYAPVYSYTKSAYTVLNYTSSKKYPSLYQTLSEVHYQKSNYTVNYSYGKQENKEGYVVNNVNTYKYTFKTITDNAMLFFIIRNTPIESDTAVGVPTVVANYGEAQVLAVNNAKPQALQTSLKYNLNQFDEKMAVSEIRFVKNDQSASGATQKLFLQNKVENQTVPYKSLITQYEEPLIAFGAYIPLGTLIYKLTDVNCL